MSLIKLNKKKLGTLNVISVRGTAPDAMMDLLRPSHAVIGAPSGNMREIIRSILDKNPAARVVVSAIALETVGEIMDCIRGLDLEEDTINVSVSRSRKIGGYHLMTAQNPVHITVCSGWAV